MFSLKEKSKTKHTKKKIDEKPQLDGLGDSKTLKEVSSTETRECLIQNRLELKAGDKWRFILSHMN